MGKIYVVLIAALLAVGQVKGNCLFSYRDLYGSNGIFTYQDDQGNLQLQLSRKVNNGVTLTIHCGGGKTHTITCKTKNRKSVFEPQLPIRCVTKPPESTVKPYTGDEGVYADCPGKVYSIGHWINGKFLKLYDVCYDTKSLRAIYSQARIFPSEIHLPRPLDKLFSPYPVMSVSDAYSFFTANIYKRFVQNYGDDQSYINEGVEVIDRGHLTASSDFLFEDQIDSTYKLVNVVPQFTSINGGNWKKVEQWVHKQALDDTGLIVRTGGFDTLKLKRGTNYKLASLIEGGKNPVPKWIYKKVIRQNPNGPGTQSALILSYNSIYEVPARRDHQFCTVVTCPKDLIFETSREAGYTVCCRSATFRVPSEQ